MDGLDSMEPHISKWQNVITSTAKTDLLYLKEEITSHVGIPFQTKLQTIQDKRVNYETLQSEEADYVEETVEPLLPPSVVGQPPPDAPIDKRILTVSF
uniref:Uncharacterized protein n=1 Tax=Panagrolaimus davidi TaxID=227884 RepID=A0A914PHP4_9BILA